jgi:hypothetical protein
MYSWYIFFLFFYSLTPPRRYALRLSPMTISLSRLLPWEAQVYLVVVFGIRGMFGWSHARQMHPGSGVQNRMPWMNAWPGQLWPAPIQTRPRSHSQIWATGLSAAEPEGWIHLVLFRKYRVEGGTISRVCIHWDALHIKQHVQYILL